MSLNNSLDSFELPKQLWNFEMFTAFYKEAAAEDGHHDRVSKEKKVENLAAYYDLDDEVRTLEEFAKSQYRLDHYQS